MNKHVFVMIRYSVLTESKDSWVIGRDADTEQYKEKLFSHERLTLHQELFLNVTLPSLRKMNSSNTTVLVFTSDELPSPFIDNLNKAVKEDDNIKIITLPRSGRVIVQMHTHLLSELVNFDSDTVYATVRLDDDDALSKDFYHGLNKYLNKEFVGYAVSFPRGIAGIYENGGYSGFYEINQPKIALGLSFINFFKKDNDVKSPVSVFGLGNHTKIDEKHFLVIDNCKPMYIRTVHGQSDAYSKSLLSKATSGSNVDAGFNVSSF